MDGTADVMRLDYPAVPASLCAIRGDVRRWLAIVAEGVRDDDVLLGVSEATSNSIVHAYPAGAAGRVVVELESRSDALEVRVEDAGSWRAGPARPGCGRGLPILHLLADDVDISSGAGGTSVTLLYRRR